MIRYLLAAGLALTAPPASAQDDPYPPDNTGGIPLIELSPSDRDAAFRASGFVRQGRQWRKCVDDPSESYSPGRIGQSGDFNSDARPDAVIVEDSTFCNGHAGSSFHVVSKQADGAWKLLTESAGMATFLQTKGASGWPDIEIGGPGFCFAVARWDGKEYKFNRCEYEGKRCEEPA
jgi:hypothetical protein